MELRRRVRTVPDSGVGEHLSVLVAGELPVYSAIKVQEAVKTPTVRAFQVISGTSCVARKRTVTDHHWHASSDAFCLRELDES